MESKKADKLNFADLNLEARVRDNLPVFKNFPVSEIFKGTPAPVDFLSHPSALDFYTRISEGAKKEPNFAGHYTIIEWGCGTGCQAGVIFDAETGKIYNLQPSEFGRDYRVSSSLLIINPDVEELFKEYPNAVPKGISIFYYKWENNNFKMIKEKKIN